MICTKCYCTKWTGEPESNVKCANCEHSYEEHSELNFDDMCRAMGYDETLKACECGAPGACDCAARRQAVAVKDCIKGQPVCRWDSYRGTDGPKGQGRLGYGDLKGLKAGVEPTNIDFLMPEILSGSDYGSSGSVEVSNHRVFLTRYGMLPNVYDVYGGAGTFAVAIRLDSITPDMIYDLNALKDYPVLDEEDHSEVERDAEEIAWDNWARHDFVKGLTKKFPALEDAIDDLGKAAVEALFYNLRDRTNTYWENEAGNNAFIHIDRIVEGATEQDILGGW